MLKIARKNSISGNPLCNWHHQPWITGGWKHPNSTRLNSLDEKKRGYMTVSELKSAVFAIQQPLAQTVPLEELLRQGNPPIFSGGQ